jgi:hypothetical protein
MGFKIKSVCFTLCIINLFSCNKPQIIDITASSSLFDKTGAYLVENLFDNDPGTSWVEASAGDGIDEEIIIKLNKKINIKSISFRNGYGKPEFWQANNRVKDIEIITEDNSFVVKLSDIPDEQTIFLTSELKGTRIVFRIKSVYKGDKFNDSALSEIKINDIEITSDLLKKASQIIDILKSEAVSFYRHYNKKQYEMYKNDIQYGEFNEINDIIKNPEKYVFIKKLSFNYAIVKSSIIYPQYGNSLIDQMQTLWQFKDNKWIQRELPVRPHEIFVFNLNADDKLDMILVYEITDVLPKEAFSIFLNIENKDLNKIFNYVASSHDLNEELTYFTGKCEHFKIRSKKEPWPIRIIKFNCKTNTIE